MRVVAPFRPFVPESEWHQESAAFDWMAAIRMMSDSVRRACGVPVQVITDHDTTLPFQMLRYATRTRRLMLWYVEIALRYLESADFDRDTVMLDSDQLVYQDLAPWFRNGVDLTIVIRNIPRDGTKNLPILNGVQWWSVAGKERLIAFYRDALALAEQMPDDRIVWGADTDALCDLLEPLKVGVSKRAGLTVRMVDSRDVLETMSSKKAIWLRQSLWHGPRVPVLDFRGRRKQFMAETYLRTFSQLAVTA